MQQRLIFKIISVCSLLLSGMALLVVYNQHWVYEFEGYHYVKTFIRGKSLGGRYDVILNYCGELCDVTKPITPGSFMGTVSAKVDCAALFHSDEIDKPSETDPIPWEEIPPALQNEYSHFGKVEIAPWFVNERKDGGGRTETFVYTKAMVQEYIDAFKSGGPKDNYGGGSSLVSKAADTIGIEGKTILTIGTQNPWLEAVLLTKNPKRIVIVEYGSFKSEYPGLEFMTPKVFKEMYKNGSLPAFDAIFSYSSLEHSGLGRYGDALNPWGDIITVARAWCVSTPNAKMALGVPTGGKDLIQFNAHRIYGPVLHPYLVTNWKFIWSTQGAAKPGPTEANGAYQPVYVFEKQ